MLDITLSAGLSLSLPPLSDIVHDKNSLSHRMRLILGNDNTFVAITMPLYNGLLLSTMYAHVYHCHSNVVCFCYFYPYVCNTIPNQNLLAILSVCLHSICHIRKPLQFNS